MIRHNLTNPLSIPDSNENIDQSNTLSNQQQLKWYAQQTTNVNDRTCDDSISRTCSPSIQQNGTRLSTNSLSSISQHTHATIATTVPFHGICISKIINICNGLEKKTINGDKFLTKNRHGRLRTADSLHVKQVLYPWATRLKNQIVAILIREANLVK